MNSVFKTPDQAFAEMDYTGKGYITQDDFFSTLIGFKIPFDKMDIEEYFVRENIFTAKKAGHKTLDIITLIKKFFPARYEFFEGQTLEEIDNGLKVDVGEKTDANNTIVIKNRLKELEKVLKIKFRNNWVSVRKAFLDLDHDFDGYITAEDICRTWGKEKRIDYNDLLILLKNKGSKKGGRLDYINFSKWMGQSIEPCEGFFFRHDSVRNPQYER